MKIMERVKSWLCPDIEVLYETIEYINIENKRLVTENKELKVTVTFLENELPESNPNESRLNDKYPKKTITYHGRYIPEVGNLDVDVRTFFTNPLSSELVDVVKSLKLDKLSDDDKALKLQDYVKKKIYYTEDKTQFGLEEYWMYPNETLKTKKGDCDDQAILLANLMSAAGIPDFKIRISAGNVYDSKGNEMGGHCFVTYYCEENDCWVAHDTTFYSDLRPIKDREDYKDSILYNKGEVWFSFSRQYAWSEI